MASVAKISSSRLELRRIIRDLNTFLAGYEGEHRRTLRRLEANAPLPDALRLLAFKGEAVARLRFAACFADLIFVQDGSFDVVGLWHDIGVREGLIFDLLAQSGLFAALSSNVRIATPTPKRAVEFYFVLIATLSERNNLHLLQRITDAFWRYHFVQLFPSAPAVVKKEDLVTLRQRLHKKLQIKFKSPIELKEAFAATNDSASFRLKYRLLGRDGVKGDWVMLDEYVGTRLKPLKFEAYLAAIDGAG